MEENNNNTLINFDTILQNLFNTGNISNNLKNFLCIELQKKTTRVLEELSILDLKTVSNKDLCDLLYTHFGDVDAQ